MQEWRGIERFVRGHPGWYGSLPRVGCINAHSGSRGCTQISRRLWYRHMCSALRRHV